MKRDDAIQLMLSGLPASGKTTYLAALWQIFETNSFNSALELDSYVGEQRYIVELNRAWADCEELPRTPIASAGLVRVRLRGGRGEMVELEVPDLSGELFHNHWAQRHWDVDFDQRVREADGIVLMMNTLAPDPVLISEVQAGEAELSSAGSDVEPAARTETKDQTLDRTEWSPSEAPDQVQMVEHLQFVAERRPESPIRVVVMLSAWDQVTAADAQAQPVPWFQRTMPLLDQFLKTNSPFFPSRVFGVSAQGGDLEADCEKLLALPPVERPIIRDGEESSHDLTLPLAWLISEERNG